MCRWSRRPCSSLACAGQHLEVRGYKAALFDMTTHTNRPHRLAKAVRGVRVAMVVDPSAINEVRRSVDSDG